jgi:type IV pilus assembly protein PilW
MKPMRSTTAQRGLTLIEMMVSMTIGLIVTAAITAVFLQSRINATQEENLARTQENARYALNLLRSELLHADFVAELVDGGSGIDTTSTPPPAPSTDCEDSSGNPWLYQIATPKNRLFYMEDVADAATAQGTYSCVGNDFKATTDILAVQRLLASPIDSADLPSADNAVYVQSNMNQAKMFHYTGSSSVPAITDGANWRFIARVYYVEEDADANVALVRENLTAGATPTMVKEVLIDGIERFRIEFGVDPNNDGVADFYTASLTNDDVIHLTTARIFVLARSPKEDKDFPPPSKSYHLGSKTVGPFPNDDYYRRVYTTTVMLRNLTYRAGLGER